VWRCSPCCNVCCRTRAFAEIEAQTDVILIAFGSEVAQEAPNPHRPTSWADAVLLFLNHGDFRSLGWRFVLYSPQNESKPNPQSDPQSLSSCTTSAYFSQSGSHRFESSSAHHIFKGLRATAKKPVPQIFHNSLDHLRGDSHLPEKRPLSGPRLVAVALGVYVQRCLDARMPQYALHRFRLDLRLIHQPVPQQCHQRVQTRGAVLSLRA